MKNYLKLVACLSIAANNSFALPSNSANKHLSYPGSGEMKFYIGGGVEANFGQHKYHLNDLGGITPTPISLGNKTINHTSTAGKVLLGMNYVLPSQWFVGVGLSVSLGSHQANYRQGNYQYVNINRMFTDATSEPIYMLYENPFSFKVKTNLKIISHLTVGYQPTPDTRFYCKLGLISMALKFSYCPSDTRFFRTTVLNKRINAVGISPTLGVEKKIGDDYWLGLEVSTEFIQSKKVKIPAYNEELNKSLEFIAFKGKTNFFNLSFILKKEI